uniref:Uncharacterized protein n=1 Tax=Anguilla anguilla TaxID=7936 RepID=A0A0E9R936_ANGAN
MYSRNSHSSLNNNSYCSFVISKALLCIAKCEITSLAPKKIKHQAYNLKSRYFT